VGSAEYLRWLEAQDYPLSAVEEVITGAKDADSVYTQYLADALKE
jgi:ParB family transcriptional regulator, chromosome partitioning protein